MDTVYAIAVSPDVELDGACFAACHSGLYRSDDGGRTWRAAYASLHLDAPLTTTAVAVSPDFSNDHSVLAGVPGAILRSNDGGDTWEVVPLPSPPPHISSMAVSPDYTRDDVLLAATLEDGVFRSADRGRSWAGWNFGLLDLHTLALAVSPGFSHDETLFVGAESGIFQSTNGGRAWREVNFPSESAPVISLALSPNFTNDGALFAGTESSGLYGSHDRGRTWARLGKNLPAGSVNAVIPSPRFPARPDVLVALSRALLVSPDGGESWSDWKADVSVDRGIVSVAAPLGLDPGAPLLVGFSEEGVRRI